MVDSILDSVKTMLGITLDDTAFDAEIVMHINSVFDTLNDLGIGPVNGYIIEDSDQVWSEFYDDIRRSSIKSYVFLRVKVLFDPPTTSFALDAIKEQIKEMEWRLNVKREGEEWQDPTAVLGGQS